MRHSASSRCFLNLALALVLSVGGGMLGSPAMVSLSYAQDAPSDLEEGMRRFWDRFGGKNAASVYQRSHNSVKESFVVVARPAAKSTVRVLINDAQASLGAVVDASGLVITKASELRDAKELKCQLYDKRTLPAIRVGENEEYDFALLKIEAEDLVAAPWGASEAGVGAWLATPDYTDTPVGIGVVSVSPRRIPKSRALIGVRLGPNPRDPSGGALVGMVFPNSGAARAGVKPNDIIVRADERDIATPDDLIAHVSGLLPGDRVRLTIRRGKEEKILTAELLEERALSSARIDTQNSLGGPISRRRSGFPRVLQHDTVLRPEQCGGPIVDLDGKVVGLNIARAGRFGSYAIPTQEVLRVLPTMVEKIDSFQDLMKNKQIAELQQRLDRSKQVLADFEKKLSNALKQRNKADSDEEASDEAKQEAKEKVNRAELQVKEARERLDSLAASLAQLQDQLVVKEDRN